jgi:peroxiredoxin
MALTASNPFLVGTLAPSFSLFDTVSQKSLDLQSLKGSKATVIFFICNHCPFVIHINSKLTELANLYDKQEISFIAISSNDILNYPQDAPELMTVLAKQEAYPFPYLFDQSQEVAKAYDAACTPDFYVFDAHLKSTYHGQFDDSRPGNSKPVTGKDLQDAITKTIQKKTIENQKPSMGCGIKWK